MIRSKLAIALRTFSLLGPLLAVGCVSDDPDADVDEELGVASDAVDLAAIPAGHADIVQDNSTPSKATGVVFIPSLELNHAPSAPVASTQYGNLPVRGSCGVTFVSPHYAITASHCFSDQNAWDPANQTFTVKTFNVAQANVNDFYFAAAMQGTFPNYTPMFGTVDQVAGYTSTTFTCKIASRCEMLGAGFSISNYNCPVSASDITMLHCASRPAPGPWVGIANDSATSGDVYMYWFHELLMSNNDPDMIAHYTNLGSQASNWHYLAAPTNAFLPFKSVPWPGGAQRSRTGAYGVDAVKTDLYGCHGTSGSGVLSQTGGVYKLLGPVRNPLWSASTLCDDPSTFTQGASGHGITYSSNTYVNNLVNALYTTTLANDRNPPPVCGNGVCQSGETYSTCPSDCPPPQCSSGKSDCCGDGVCRTYKICKQLQCL